MIGITSYGAYIPRLRLDRMAIFQAMGWFAPAIMMVAQGERSMCNWDEDSLTMAVAASGVVAEPVRVGSASGHNGAGHLGDRIPQHEAPPGIAPVIRREDDGALPASRHHDRSADGEVDAGGGLDHAPGSNGQRRAGSHLQIRRDEDPRILAPVDGRVDGPRDLLPVGCGLDGGRHGRLERLDGGGIGQRSRRRCGRQKA